jgi:hypothetical protein
MMAINESNSPERENPARKAAGEVKSSARQASREAKQQAAETLDENRERAADELDKIAHAARAAASDLEDQEQEGLSDYVADMAQGIGSFANSLRRKNMDELLQEAREVARRNPALFIAGSIAVGFGLSRFAKASVHHQHGEQEVSIRESAEPGIEPEATYPPVGGSPGRADAERWPGGR